MQKEDDGFNNSEADGDPAAAFARVEDRLASVHGEVALLRAAIEGLTAARENIEIPDYEPTLERTEKILIALTDRTSVVSGKSVSVRVDLGGRSIIKKKTQLTNLTIPASANIK